MSSGSTTHRSRAAKSVFGRKRRHRRRRVSKLAYRGKHRLFSFVGDIGWYIKEETAQTTRLISRSRRFLRDSLAEFLAKFRA